MDYGKVRWVRPVGDGGRGLEERRAAPCGSSNREAEVVWWLADDAQALYALPAHVLQEAIIKGWQRHLAAAQ